MADPFTIDSSADGEADYRDILRRRRWTFLDPNETTITRDPIEFAVQAFSAATPRSERGYLSFASPIAWARLYRGRRERALFAYVRVMTRPIEPLVELGGWSGWEFRDGGLGEPSEEQIAKVPAMCTSTLLLFTIPTDRLHVPQDTPQELTVTDATTSVARLVELLNKRVRPVLQALDSGLMTPKEVADLFCVGTPTVRRWAKAGRLTEVRTPGGRPRYHRDEVMALLAGETPEQRS